MSEISAPKKNVSEKYACHQLFSHISAVIGRTIYRTGFGTT